MKRVFFGVAALAAMAAAAPALAVKTVTVTTTFDLALASKSATGFTMTGSNVGNYSVVEGDTLDYTINFGAGQSVSVTTLKYVSEWLAAISGAAATNVTQTGTITFLGTGGSVSKTDTEGTDHIGQAYSSSQLTSLPTTFTFNGLHYVGTVSDYTDPSVTFRTYDTPSVQINALGYSINGVAAVPEPASWGMMILGFGVVGAGLRRTRVRVAFAV